MKLPFLLFLLAGPASAGSVYLNGVRADSMRNQEFNGVDVRIDDQGNIWIEGSQYVVKVVDQAGAPPPTAAGVEMGRFWLVTQDDGSQGHVVEVAVNGTVVRRIRSGEAQLILDIAPWLVQGKNEIIITALPGSPPGGGDFHVFIGKGGSEAGVVRMQDPEIDFVRKASDPATGATRRFTMSVP